MIVNPTKEQIAEYLAKIKWSLKHRGHERYSFLNEKGRDVGMILAYPDTDSRVEFQEYQGKTTGRKPCFYFYMKDCVVELLDNECVSFRGKTDKGIFILLQNFNLPKHDKE